MAFNVDLIKPRILEALRTGNLVPFIGAGVSKQARTSDPTAFPTWTELIQALQRRAREHGDIDKDENDEMDRLLKCGKHLMVAEALRHAMGGDRFDKLIKEKCSPHDAEPGEIHHRLFDLKCPLIVTTNYDSLLEDACAKRSGRHALTYTFDNASAVQHHLQGSREVAGKPLIFKIHGDIEQNPKNVVLTETAYRRLLYHEPGYRTILSAIFVTRVVLMMGFSFSDPELTVMMESIRESLKKGSPPDYLILPEGEKGPVEKKRLEDDFGIEVIEYSVTPGHPELLELVDYLASWKEKNQPAVMAQSR